MKSAMQPHGVNDWCHLCGERRDDTVDIWFPGNAEHDKAVVPGQPHSGRKYIRICGGCGDRIHSVAISIVERN